jgi:hypothetical protein
LQLRRPEKDAFLLSKELKMIDPESSGVSVGNFHRIMKRIEVKQRCDDFFRTMSAKGKSKGRIKKVNRLHLSISTKRKHK